MGGETSSMLVFRFTPHAWLRVRASTPWLREHFQAEYAYHRTTSEQSGTPYVALDWSPPRAVPTSIRAASRWAWHKGLAFWRYAVQPEAEGLHLWAWGNRWAGVLIQHMLVHHGLHWLLSQRGTLLLHAGAVVIDGQSWLLIARGGVGKTALTAHLLAQLGPQRAQLHSDDFVFIAPHAHPPQSNAYITRAHLYQHHLKAIPGLAARLHAAEIRRLRWLGWVRRLSRGRLRWAVRVPLSRLWPGYRVADRATVGGWIWLEPGPTCRGPEPWPANAAHEAIVAMQFYEARHFIRLVERARPKNWPADWLDSWHAREAALVAALLQARPGYRLIVPPGRDLSLCAQALQSLVES
ncbi:MAG: hypothetical protein GXO54_00595 [Chloroflexi bacterium]|nr:hypothetical protein [Chloroflexota bacterium]